MHSDVALDANEEGPPAPQGHRFATEINYKGSWISIDCNFDDTCHWEKMILNRWAQGDGLFHPSQVTRHVDPLDPNLVVGLRSFSKLLVNTARHHLSSAL